MQYFYPRPPRGGRLLIVGDVNIQFPISIHALREEGDVHRKNDDLDSTYISIHALREEGDAAHPSDREQVSQISIHALREEGDNAQGIKTSKGAN